MLAIPDEYVLIDPPLEERGNLLLRTGDRILKIYRQRGSRGRELLSGFSHWLFEGKRGTSPHARRETERLGLLLWAEHGFPVPQVLEGEIPDWVGDLPSLWLSVIEEEQRLHELLWDEAVPDARKQALVALMAREDHRRHRLALELKEPLLLHEHPTTKHKLVVGEEALVTIDLEGGYLPDYPVPLAVAYEVAGLGRSMWRNPDLPCFEQPWPQVYLEAYDDRALLREVCDHAARSFRLRSKAWNDRRSRKARAKSSVLEELRRLVG